jgi:hypothetical protein
MRVVVACVMIASIQVAAIGRAIEHAAPAAAAGSIDPAVLEPFEPPVARTGPASPVGGSIWRPLLVVYARYDDLTVGDSLTAAQIRSRFFGTQAPSFASMVAEASGGRMGFYPAETSDGLNGVVIVDMGPSPVLTDATWTQQIIDAPFQKAISDGALDVSVFDTRDADGNLTPDANHDGRPDGDGRIGPMELAVDIMRETQCMVPNPQDICENGGVAPGGAFSAVGSKTFDMFGALTTISTNTITHLHELFHAFFRFYQDYQPAALDITSGTILGGNTGLTEGWWLASAWTRFLLGWVVPGTVKVDGRYRLPPGAVLAIPDTSSPKKYVLVEGRYPADSLSEQDATPGVAVWAAEDDDGPNQRLFAPSNGATWGLGQAPGRYMWVDAATGAGTDGQSTFSLGRVYVEPDGVFSISVDVDDGTARTEDPPYIIEADPTPIGRTRYATLDVRIRTNTPPAELGYYLQYLDTDGTWKQGGGPAGNRITLTDARTQDRSVSNEVPARLGADVMVRAVLLDATGVVATSNPVVSRRIADDGINSYAVSTWDGPTGFEPGVLGQFGGTSTATFRASVAGTTVFPSDLVEVEVPDPSAVDGSLGTAQCTNGIVIPGSPTDSRVDVTSTLVVGLDTGDLLNGGVDVYGLTGTGAVVRRIGHGLEIECPPPTLELKVSPFRPAPYTLRLRHEVRVDEVPIAARWADGQFDNPRRSFAPARCPGGAFPECLQGPVPFMVQHPIDPGPDGPGACAADGCPDFVPFRWAGGRFAMTAFTNDDLSFNLIDESGELRPFTGSSASYRSTASSGGDDFTAEDDSRMGQLTPQTRFAYELDEDLPKGWYALAVRGAEGSYQVRLNTELDLDGDLVKDTDDVCPSVPDDGQEDADGDGLGGACDVSPGPFVARVMGIGRIPVHLGEDVGTQAVEVRLDRPNYTGTPIEIALESFATLPPSSVDLSSSIATIPPGLTSALVPYTVIADDIDEDDVGIGLVASFTDPSLGSVVNGPYKLTVVDDDEPGGGAPSITVSNDASPASVPEPGAAVTFDVAVTNDSDGSVTLDGLTDDTHGDLDGQGSCSVPQAIAADGTYRCSFSAFVGPDAGTYTSNVTATATDGDGGAATDVDDAVVTVTDVAPTITVAVDSDVPVVTTPGGDVTYTVAVTNTSVEPVRLTSLVDDEVGDLDGEGSCATGGAIAIGDRYTCSFTAFVTGAADSADVRVITATATDDEDNAANDSDDATVLIKAPTGLIVPSSTTCATFRDGGAGNLTELAYGVRSGKVNNVAPGTLSYYSTVDAPARSFTIDVLQHDSSAAFPAFGIQQRSHVTVWSNDCTKSRLATVTITDGNASINVIGATPGERLIVTVKYDPGTVVGTTVGSQPYPSVDYSLTTSVNGSPILTSPDRLVLAAR